MAEALVKLKKRAIKAGMKKSEAKTASRSELEDFLSNGSSPAKAKKKGVAKKGKAGRPKAAEPKAKPKAEKPKAKPKAKPKKSDDVGRREIGKVKFTGYDEDDWNPREGSAVETIFKSLKRHKGDVEKVFAELKGKASSFAASKTDAQGNKRDKAWFLKNLRYRINRTLFEFAVKTGQHEVATNRTEYGTGDYAKATRKAKRKSSNKSKTSTKAKGSAKKGGRKKSSKK